jgi:hypothetical protein
MTKSSDAPSADHALDEIAHIGEAEYCLRGALELNPALTREHTRLSVVLQALQRFDAALA